MIEAHDQAGGVPAVAAQGLHVTIELIHQCRDGQGDAAAARLIQAQAQVLAHPVHRKAEVELPVGHGLAAVVHLPGLRRALADDIQHLPHVQTGHFTEVDGLGQPLHQAGDADLVDHLGQLSGAHIAHAGDGLRVGHRDRAHPFHIGLGAAAHDGEAAFLGARLSTRDRGIDEVQAMRTGRRIQLAADLGRGRGVVHVERAGLHADKGAVFAQHHAAQVVVIAHAREHDVGVLRGLTRGKGQTVATGGSVAFDLGQPAFCFGRGAVVHADRMSGLCQMACHRIAHHAQAQEGDLERWRGGRGGGLGVGVHGGGSGVIGGGEG